MIPLTQRAICHSFVARLTRSRHPRLERAPSHRALTIATDLRLVAKEDAEEWNGTSIVVAATTKGALGSTVTVSGCVNGIVRRVASLPAEIGRETAKETEVAEIAKENETWSEAHIETRS